MKKYQFILLLTSVMLACVFLACCAGPKYTKDSFPGWTWIAGHDDGNALYVDKKNIQNMDGKVRAWYKMTDGSDSLTFFLEIDCSAKKYRNLSTIRYDKNGNPKETMGEQQNWSYAAITTGYYMMMKEVCPQM